VGKATKGLAGKALTPSDLSDVDQQHYRSALQRIQLIAPTGDGKLTLLDKIMSCRYSRSGV